MRSFFRATGWLLLFSGITSCATITPYIDKKLRDWETLDGPDSTSLLHSVYFVGDGGDMVKDDPILPVLHKALMGEPEGKSSIIYMGDNIYLHGLPPEDAPDRERKEEVINLQMQVTDGYSGNVLFIPGNHDWDYSGPDGIEYINREEDYIESYYADQNQINVFRPDNGCPGPSLLPVNDRLVIIVVDSEWWVHPYDVPHAPENGCTVESKIDLIIQLEDLIRKNKNKNIILTAHHPIISNGNHGGHFNLLDNIFPLRLVRDNLYIPLPLVGSLYPLLRKAGASPQDIPSTTFQEYKQSILSLIADKPNILYASGHDHNLQLHKQDQTHQLISGSVSKTNFAARGFGASFIQQKKGYAVVRYYDNGETWIEFHYVDLQHEEGAVSFRAPLYALDPTETTVAEKNEIPDYRDSTRTLAANPNYTRSAFGKFFLGNHYRKEWTTPVKLPYLDLKTYAGGLKPVKLGGGRQTISIRFMNPDSVQYNLRSVEKFPAGAIPDIFRATWVNDFAKDQISTSHPYGALTTPEMADALGLYYTKPELYYTPFTPTLGAYIDDFGGRMGMIEIRPDEDLSEFENFGYSENVVSTSTMLDNLQDDNDNEIDADMYLRNRLFDMLIGDWDRHEDQWRWAEYDKEGKGELYKPVARDRDQVYVLYDGVIPWLLSRKWSFRNFSNFDYDISDIQGLNFSARNIDRRLLNHLSRHDWHKQVVFVQSHLTNEIIEKAIRTLPKEIFPLSGPEIIAKLEKRRDDLEKYADEYYDFLADKVDIVGSNKDDYFEIKRLNDQETEISYYTENKERLIYRRVFYTGETREINLYGLEEEDKFVLTGKVGEGPKIRIIGGKDQDSVTNYSVVSKGRRTILYDDPSNAKYFITGSDTKLRLSKKTYVNDYNYASHEYNYTGPKLSFQYNEDDGLYLGGGVKLRRHGFRKDPAKLELSFLGNVAFQTRAFNFAFGSTFYSIFGHRWDLRLDAEANGPNYVFNYFGSGNNSDYSENIPYYRVKVGSVHFTPSIQKRIANLLTLRGFIGYSYVDVKDPEEEESIINDLPETPQFNTEPASFGNVGLEVSLALVDHPVNPEKGVKFTAMFDYKRDLTNEYANFTRINSSLSLYFTPNIPVRITFASRVGFATNLGDFYFYQSNFLGGLTNLRSFRRTRFAGKNTFFNNNEIRLPLINVRNNLINGSVGLLGFTDVGKAWNEAKDTSKMHISYGPGLYFHFFEVFLVSATYGISEDSNYFTFSSGFLF